ncbi:MAG: hypothetical protein V1853_05210 [bacterium]
MANKPAKQKRNVIPTQRYIDILEIKDDIVVLKDGTIRAVLLVSSINFSLKSEEEQNAVIASYTQFLNSLDFSIQIVIQSRKLNIDNYLERLKESELGQRNELLRMQTREYREYVSELIQIADLMSKRFYVVIPFMPHSDKPKRFFNRILEALSPSTVIHLKQRQFMIYREELLKRADYVIDGLSASGLKSIMLDTQSLIELYYNTYNPESVGQQKFADLSKVNVEGGEYARN